MTGNGGLYNGLCIPTIYRDGGGMVYDIVVATLSREEFVSYLRKAQKS